MDSVSFFDKNCIQKYHSEGRNILILSDRREHLNTLFHMLHGYSVGFYVGGMKPDELRESQEKNINRIDILNNNFIITFKYFWLVGEFTVFIILNIFKYY